MKCPHCNAELPDDSKFCNYCGEKLNIRTAERENDTRPRDEKFDYVDHYVRPVNEEKEPVKEQKLWVIFSIIGAGVLFAVVALLTFYGIKTHQKTVISAVSTTVAEESMTSQSLETETEPLESSITEITRNEELETETIISDSSEEPSVETAEPETEVFTETAPPETVAEETTVTEAVTEAPFVSKEEREYGGMIYMFSDTEAVLKRCYSSDAVIALSDKIYGIQNTAIYEGAFSGCTHITHMDLPEGIKTISANAFAGCTSLQEVVIPPTVTEIGAGAFSGIPNLIVIGTPGSFAESYASANGYPFKEGVTVSPFLGQ